MSMKMKELSCIRKVETSPASGVELGRRKGRKRTHLDWIQSRISEPPSSQQLVQLRTNLLLRRRRRSYQKIRRRYILRSNVNDRSGTSSKSIEHRSEPEGRSSRRLLLGRSSLVRLGRAGSRGDGRSGGKSRFGRRGGSGGSEGLGEGVGRVGSRDDSERS